MLTGWTVLTTFLKLKELEPNQEAVLFTLQFIVK